MLWRPLRRHWSCLTFVSTWHPKVHDACVRPLPRILAKLRLSHASCPHLCCKTEPKVQGLWKTYMYKEQTGDSKDSSTDKIDFGVDASLAWAFVTHQQRLKNVYISDSYLFRKLAFHLQTYHACPNCLLLYALVVRSWYDEASLFRDPSLLMLGRLWANSAAVAQSH